MANISLGAESDYVIKGSIVSNNTLAPNSVFIIQLKHEIYEKGILLLYLNDYFVTLSDIQGKNELKYQGR